MSLEDQINQRNPVLEISKKTLFGFGLSVAIVILYSVVNSVDITNDSLSTTLFLMGGVFLLVGAMRDVFGSLIVRKIRKKDINEYLQSDEIEYLFGFGIAGEDVVSGVGLIILSIFASIIL